MGKNNLLIQGIDPDNESGKGIKCTDCGCYDLRVVRTVRKITGITRYRKCRNCGKNITTREKIKLK